MGFWRRLFGRMHAQQARSGWHSSTCRLLGFAEAQARAAAYREHRRITSETARADASKSARKSAVAPTSKELIDSISCGHATEQFLRPTLTSGVNLSTAEVWRVCRMCPTKEAFHYVDLLDKRVVSLGV